MSDDRIVFDPPPPDRRRARAVGCVLLFGLLCLLGLDAPHAALVALALYVLLTVRVPSRVHLAEEDWPPTPRVRREGGRMELSLAGWGMGAGRGRPNTVAVARVRAACRARLAACGLDPVADRERLTRTLGPRAMAVLEERGVAEFPAVAALLAGVEALDRPADDAAPGRTPAPLTGGPLSARGLTAGAPPVGGRPRGGAPSRSAAYRRGPAAPLSGDLP